MTEAKKNALVLHLTTGGEPLVYALTEESAEALARRLHKLMTAGEVYNPQLEDESRVLINFAHVAAAHFDDLPPTRVYGSAKREPRGFTR